MSWLLLLGFRFSFSAGIFLVVLRPVSTSPPQGEAEARCPFRARELGFVRSTFWCIFATAWGFAREFFLLLFRLRPRQALRSHISRFRFSLALFPSLICGSDNSRGCRSRYLLDFSIPFPPPSVLRLCFSAAIFSPRLHSLAG